MFYLYFFQIAYSSEFFIYLICRTVIKTPEVLIFLDISKMSFRLNGTCLAFPGSRVSLWILACDLSFSSSHCSLSLRVTLFFSASFSHHTYTDNALYVHIRCSLHNHIPQGLCISILLFALCPEMPQFTSVMADIKLFMLKDPCLML